MHPVSRGQAGHFPVARGKGTVVVDGQALRREISLLHLTILRGHGDILATHLLSVRHRRPYRTTYPLCPIGIADCARSIALPGVIR